MERLTKSDKELWRQDLREISSARFVLEQRLGYWTKESHRRHRWFYNPATEQVFHQKPTHVDVYDNQGNSRPTRGGQVLRRSAVQQMMPSGLQWCATKKSRNGRIILRNAEPLGFTYRTPPKATTVRDILLEWGELWIWDNLDMKEGEDMKWLTDALLS